MRYLILSDIHANLEALEATLAAAGPYDQALVLGDLVGYGADPNAVIDRVRALPVAAMVRGNHDKVAAGLDGIDGFNQIARDAVQWTTAALTRDNHAWLSALPKGPVVLDATIEICHGTPFDEDMYVFDDLDALRALRSAARPLCLYGHTHVPAVFQLTPPEAATGVSATIGLTGPPGRSARFEVHVEAECQYLVNCGAIGQPRDADPRAGYGMVDTDAGGVTMLRVEYDVRAAQRKILAAGLPEMLARRLAIGR
ncbi:MAG: metallophosphoesterase family protein [Acidobacteria bacterium]|nr:metallophosphoesterase family protein [Acidobacteriota bacterium]